MSSETDICNLALSHLGQGKEIQDIDTDDSEEASACRRFYDDTRDTTLRDYQWPFATAFATLALVEEDPTEEWAFSYQYPTDCVMIRRVFSGARTDSRQSRVPYKVVRTTSGSLVYTDQEDAQIEYTFREENPERYQSDFIMAFSWRLAAYIAPRVTGGDPFRLRQQALQMYDFEITRARANASNEEQPDQNREAEWIEGRN